MSAGLALARAEIVRPADTLDKVTITVRQGTATVYRDGTLVGTFPGVQRVEHPDRATWRLTFANGDEWTVRRTGGCGCGR